ncbi:DUF4102 domain-containing protein [Parashewanella curva]|uniref:DUF4102 domain-containing protein n=1 Tax=Parashewanella curva TaxID=2338552 RepID=A0A3L8PT85_9GAMM|nr:site-specific integrase [Parashewanella curva]RLV58029.1 DUF4102 domain-containing protein [Parashewanella curva]
MTSVKMKITDSLLKQVPEEISRINDTELSGFYAQMGKTSDYEARKHTFYLYYRFGGRDGIQRRYSIGKSNVLTATDARKEAIRLKAKISLGEDVYISRKENRSAIKKSKLEPDVNQLSDEFMNIYVRPHRKRPDEVARMLSADIIPAIGSIKLNKLNRRLVISKALDPIVARGSKVQANKTLSLLKQMFDFGIQRGLLEHNPLTGTKRMVIGGKETARSRNLSLDEIKLVFLKLPTLGVSHQVITILKLLLFTACRVNEITSAKWQDIDFEKQEWTIPKENVKSKKGAEKEHKIPLNDSINSLLYEAKNAYAYLNSEFVFPSLTCTTVAPGTKPIDKRSVARAINRNIDNFGIEAFTPHDLRRTAATLLGKLSVDPIVIEKVLNHELVGVMAIYNQYKYMEKRAVALKKLAELINDRCQLVVL